MRLLRSTVDFDGVKGITREKFLVILHATLPRASAPPLDAWHFSPRLHLVLFEHRVTGLESGMPIWLRAPADVLFDLPTVGEDDLGAKVIRGLIRSIHDIAKENNSTFAKPNAPGLELIAISRADDQEKIQSCLLSGASGYVLKSRLLSLPLVLNSTAQGVTKESGAWHRNFRALYNLPREVIGLLRTTRMEGLDLKLGLGSDLDISPRQDAMARLIQSIPKTDLHVHVGSLMTPEFLSIASFIMLLRFPGDSNKGRDIRNSIRLFSDFWRGHNSVKLWLHQSLCPLTPEKPYELQYTHGKDAVEHLAVGLRQFLIQQIAPFIRGAKFQGSGNQSGYSGNFVATKAAAFS